MPSKILHRCVYAHLHGCIYSKHIKKNKKAQRGVLKMVDPPLYENIEAKKKETHSKTPAISILFSLINYGHSSANFTSF